MKNEVVALLQKLVAIKSPYFEEEEIMSFASGWLQSFGLTVAVHSYTEAAVTGFSGKNIVCTLDSGRPGPCIHLNGHLDTVQLCGGWTKDPYGGIIEGDRLYGLGALDMKGGCAAIMQAVAAFGARGRPFSGKVILTLVGVEEGPYGIGSNALIEEGVLPEKLDVTIVAEPSAGFTGIPFPTMCLGARGGYGLKVELFGKAAHAASPQLGISAAVDMARLVCRLEDINYMKDEKLGRGESCVINMAADGGACSVPDYASFGIFRHIVRGETKQSIIEEIEQAAAGAGIASRVKISFRPAPSEGSEGFLPYVTEENHPQVESMRRVIEKTCGQPSTDSYFQSIGDFCYFGTRVGAPCIIFGPDGRNYHGPDEYVTISSLAQTAEIIYNFLIAALEAQQ